MGNRADRRASAKIARQAVKRAKLPTEAAILRAAAAFSGDGLAGPLGSCLSDADFDDAWLRLNDDLRDILADGYSDFMTQVYAEAGLGTLRVAGSGGAESEMATRMFLFPVSGSQDRLSAFAADAGEINRLETSLLESGLVPEGGRCLVLPLVLPIAAFAPDTTPPGRVRAIHDYLSHRLIDRLSGTALPSREGIRDAVRDFCGVYSDAVDVETRYGALIGIELVPVPRAAGTEVSEEEVDVQDMTKAAAIDSWHDSYAAEVSEMAIGAPLDWPACAAALGWETIRIPMEAALRAHGVAEGRPDAIHCATTDDGERLIVTAVSGSVAVGPFSLSSALVWFDADEFFGRAEASAGSLVEHGSERDVIAPLLAPPGRSGLPHEPPSRPSKQRGSSSSATT